MPRVLIDISDTWLQRYETGVTQLLDTLEGLRNQLEHARPETVTAAYGKMADIASQLDDLKRNVESWRLMF